VVIAGPCSVESREQIILAAQQVKESGGHALRGGAFKPRSNPYSFQGLGERGLQILQAAAVGLKPKAAYVLAIADNPKGEGKLQPLAGFMTSPSGSAVVNAVGPLRNVVSADTPAPRRYLVIAEGKPDELGMVVQTQR
jgi:hypothetical protein